MASSNRAVERYDLDLSVTHPWLFTAPGSTPNASAGWAPPTRGAQNHQWTGAWNDSHANNSQTFAPHTVNNTYNVTVDNSTHNNVNQRYDPRSNNVVNNTNSNNVVNSHNRRFDTHTHGNVNQQSAQINWHNNSQQQNVLYPTTQGQATHASPQTFSPPPYYEPSQGDYSDPWREASLPRALLPDLSRPPKTSFNSVEPSCTAFELRERTPAPKSKHHRTRDEEKRRWRLCRVMGCPEQHVHRMLQKEPRKVGGGFLYGGQKKMKEHGQTKVVSDFCDLHTCRGRGEGRSGQFCQCPSYPGDRFCWCCAARENGGDVGAAA